MVALLSIFMVLGMIGLSLCAVALVRAAMERREWGQWHGDGDNPIKGTWMTVVIPDGGSVYTAHPNGPECTLDTCPPGFFLWCGRLCIKRGNTHPTSAGSIEDTGDDFPRFVRGDVIMVQPILMEKIHPEPFWVEE